MTIAVPGQGVGGSASSATPSRPPLSTGWKLVWQKFSKEGV